MDPEVATQLCALGEEKFHLFKAGCTEEQKAKAEAWMEERKSDPEFGAKQMAKMQGYFTGADANNDGVLDRDEYLEFVRLGEVEAKEQGWWVLESPEHVGKVYAVANLITPGTDGVSMADIMQAAGVLGKKMEELKAEHGI